MLRDKLSHLALLDEQLERLQQSANEISIITGHDLESVEGAILSLITKRAADGAKRRVNPHLSVGKKGAGVQSPRR